MSDYDSASVRVMRSYDYCHFEIQLGWNAGEKSQEISYENVDELRKEAARLVDKAVEQYKQMKRHMDFVNSSEYDYTKLQSGLELLHKTKPDKSEWTPVEIAMGKRFNDLVFYRSMSYDYQDDWNDDYSQDTDELPF